jgi:hypothetical protein
MVRTSPFHGGNRGSNPLGNVHGEVAEWFNAMVLKTIEEFLFFPGFKSLLLRKKCGNSSVGRVQPCQGWGREFESRFPLNG